MTDTITLTGVIGTDPAHRVVSGGTLPITSFRLASTERKRDKTTNEWKDGDTSWYTVSAFKHLAINAAASLKKGQRVIVIGRPKVKAWENKDKSGIDVEIDADVIGHDLTLGTSSWERVVHSTSRSASSNDGRHGGSDVDSEHSVQSWPTTAVPDDDDTDDDGATEASTPADDTVPAPF